MRQSSKKLLLQALSTPFNRHRQFSILSQGIASGPHSFQTCLFIDHFHICINPSSYSLTHLRSYSYEELLAAARPLKETAETVKTYAVVP
jgi:hypothetical protein